MNKFLSYINKPSDLEILMFTKNLAVLLKSGVPIVESLETLIAQSSSGSFKLILEDIKKELLNGQTLTTALKRHTKIFGNLYISLIEASELTGALDTNLQFIYAQLDRISSLKKKIKSATLYPGIILSVLFILGGFIFLFILPKLTDFFDLFEITLPFATKILIRFSLFSKNYGFLTIILLIILFVSFKFFTKSNKTKPYWDKLILKIPVVNRYIKLKELAVMSRTLGMLVNLGMPISKSISTTSNTLSNSIFKTDLDSIKELLNSGKNISDSITKYKFIEFPPLTVKMISVGEKTGKLDETLLYLSDYYDEELDYFSKNLTSIIEPVLLVIIGLIVGFVALAIISPIYELSSSIR